jgi:transmembrane sensor
MGERTGMEENQSAFEKADLIVRHLRGELNPQEEEILAQWLQEDARNRQFLDTIRNERDLQEKLRFFSSLDTDDAWRKVASRTGGQGSVIHFGQKVAAWKYAAAILLLLTAGMAVFRLTDRKKAGDVVAQQTERLEDGNLPAGGDKAKLTLADGSIIILQDLANGTMQEKGGMKIIKKDGQVVIQYSGNKNAIAGSSLNTISTPVGGQYQIVLPDNSKIWLNSASSLRFPTAFTAKERSVELTGEGYFEIAKHKHSPFKVKANQTTIEVLGTHFNVMAYANESSTNTTLIEGSVKVSNGATEKVIVPGQQARVSDDIELVDVDIEEAVAWKNGLFLFNNADLGTIMRQIERRYDVEEVVYAGEVPSKHFTGQISRDTKLPQVLKMLELSGVISFKIEGRRIIVLPNNSQ